MHHFSMKGFVIAILVAGFVNRFFAQKQPLHIGGLFQSMAVLPGANTEMEYGTRSALDFVNSNPDILPEYELVMIDNFTGISSATMTGEALSILYDFVYEKPQLLMLVVSTSSRVAQPVCEVASHYNLIQVSGTASSPGFSDKERYPLFLRLYPSDTILIPAWEALLRNFNWRKVAIIYEDEEIFGLLMRGLVSLLRERGGYEVLTVEHTQNGFQPTAQIQSLKNHNARIIIALAYPDMTRQIMCEAYRLNLYGQKFVWMLFGWLNTGWYLERIGDDDITCTDAQMESVVNGYLSIKVLSYTQDFNDVNFQGVTPNQADLDLFTGMQSTYYYAGFVYDAMMCVAIALNNSENLLSGLDPPRHLTDFTYQDAEMAHYIRDSVQGLALHGVTGKIEFTANGDRISELIIEQMQEQEMVRVGMYDVGHDSFKWSESSPIRWQGRLPPTDGVEEIRVIAIPSFPARIVMYTLACIGILFALACLVLNIKYRKLGAIKISSPFLNNFILTGCILLYILIILYGADTSKMTPLQFTVQCHGQPILLSIGLSLAFGALFMKTYRVYAIFKIAMEKFGDIRVGDSRLITGVVVMVIVDIIISLSWIIIDPLSSTLSVLQSEAITDENGHDFIYIYQSRQCNSVYSQYWTISLFVYKAVLLFFGVFLAWAIRSVQVAALNESRQIAFSVYVVALVCVITPLAQYFLPNQVTLVYTITGTGVFLANTLVLCLAFGPKIISLHHNPYEVNTSTVNSNKRDGSQARRSGQTRKDSKKKQKSVTVATLKETLNNKSQELFVLTQLYRRLCLELAYDIESKTE